MGMGTENENEASFAKSKSHGQDNQRILPAKEGNTDYAIKFSVSFRLKRLLYMGLVFDKRVNLYVLITKIIMVQSYT
jgi:hypothetical protein